MKSFFSAKVRQLFDIFLSDTPNLGDTSAELRRSVEQYAANLSRADQEAPVIPSELEAFVRKVTLHAYKVTDEEINDLKATGYTEDELFEITISAALGAGRTRLECGLAAIKWSETVAHAKVITSKESNDAA